MKKTVVITVSVVDDDRMLIEGLAAWLAGVPDVRLTGWAATVEELLATEPEPADVVLLDLLLADRSDPVDNLRTLVRLRRRVLVVSVVTSGDMARQMIRAGAGGYLTKDHDLAALVAKVREVAKEEVAISPELALGWLADQDADRPALSPQERAVLLAYASGMTLIAAARSAGVQPGTARNYLERVKDKYRKAGRPAYTKLDLAARVREDGLAT
ncbi:helix-turn-helix transcriptional regulator [Nonomuraea muscovyensis]|uniref:DNA-binding NarL/FixJ family response regulator n=1 Tax=Nonomuraea muscovyensis TaxID=1124761 RepID=A0A7X0C495_9ACTN|nr:response regulator [Nonomuraea muscovyensis]MBB6346439.1 DNA-binding NarL/FixJ family response regulator [Nonomuraea muscovyensis]MDF2708920.1 DNA-binding response regulator [Nonomuraea muscovyensis]